MGRTDGGGRFRRHSLRRCVAPPLTTIAQPMRAIGEGTVGLLLEILHDDSEAPRSVTLPHTLTIRSSTAPPRANRIKN